MSAEELISAATSGDVEKLTSLLQTVSADATVPGDEEGWTALIRASQYNHVPCVKALLSAGAPPCPPKEARHRPLRAATLAGNLEITRILLEAGADVDGLSKGNVTALHGACMNGHLDVAKLLLEKGADVKLVNGYGEDAIQVAQNFDKPTIVEYLLNWSQAACSPDSEA